jgi:uncharacterized damage-inducible protein DinB
MAIKDAVAAEFDQEMMRTRKCLERVPDEKLGWKPHSKSRSLGQLAAHIAAVPGNAARVLEADEFNANPPASAPAAPKSRAELLEVFDGNVAKSRELINKTSDEVWMKPWSFLFKGQKVFTLPKIAALRAITLSHLIHHRGQFTVYLRLNDVPVPGVYGPSADE